MSIETIKNSPNIKKTTVTIDSENKSSGSESNFTYNLSNGITEVRLIEITNVELINSNNNINSYTEFFTYTDTLGVSHPFRFTESYESVNSFIRFIQNTMNSSKTNRGQNYLVRFNGIDKITFSTLTGVTRFELNFLDKAGNNIAPLIGFGSTNYTGSTQYTSPNPIDFVYTKNLFIGSTNLGQNAFDKYELSNGISNIIKKVELNSDYGDIIYDTNNRIIRNSISNLSTIDITLKDDEGRDAILTNNKIKITLDIYSRVYNNSYSI